MNYKNVVKSFFLGIFIGVALQSINPAAADVTQRLWSVLAAGGLGLIIGLVTEWTTSLLPLRIARTRTYFLLNNVIAMVVTAPAMVLLTAFAASPADARWGWWPFILTAVAIVGAANGVEYLLYRRTQRRLGALKAKLATTPDKKASA